MIGGVDFRSDGRRYYCLLALPLDTAALSLPSDHPISKPLN
jgi:hypothetical protein